MQVDIQEAEKRLAELLALVERDGTAVVILRDGKPIAELAPPRDVKEPSSTHPGVEDEWPMTDEEIAEWTEGDIYPT